MSVTVIDKKSRGSFDLMQAREIFCLQERAAVFVISRVSAREYVSI